MLLREAITRGMELREDMCTEDEICSWISSLDGKIATETLHTELTPYSFPEDAEAELLIYPPYDSAYIHYIMAMADYMQGEYSKYNNGYQMYNDELEAFRVHYIRNNLPPRRDLKNIM